MAISNNEIKRIKSLQRKKYRDETGLFIAEGEKMIQEALASSFEVDAIHYKADIGEDGMARITALTNPSPVLAVIRKPADIYIDEASELEHLLSCGGLFLALDSIRDPGNLGTILRIADWFGIDAVFASRDTVDVFNPKVVQATMGAIFRVVPRFFLARIASTTANGFNLGMDSPTGSTSTVSFPSLRYCCACCKDPAL